MKRIFISTFFILLFSFVSAQAGEVYFIELKGVITGTSHKFIQKGINEANDKGALAVVIKLDTPGGLVDATRQIVQEILSSGIPVVVYVSPAGAQAGSAGTFITLAADYAYMAEGTNIGAAHPVNATGNDIEGDMREKAINDITSFMRSIAEKRKRNMEEAELAIRESKSFTATEALNAGLIDAIVENDDALLTLLSQELSAENLSRVDFTPTLTERLSFVLANPNIILMLLFVGSLMIFLEFKMPGSFVFAGVGIVAFVIFLFGVNLIPINYLGLSLIILGVALIVAEIFVTSYGLFAVAGLISIIGGARLLFDTVNVQGVEVSLRVLIAIALVFATIVILIGHLVAKDFKRKPATGKSSLVGRTAEVLKWSDIDGAVDVHGEIWRAISKDNFKRGDKAVIESVDGLTLTIKKQNT